ncbi:putative importin beta-5 [Phaeomoniella chlamydospora]|uniref:Putative importin beta-5 n=1 Tax=Phaeomoniella chlamydospora TaxID=158046 RepID=A0A0G2GB40_PHACM|nr:putative importin beta-5 [Phaeomoniella chlamydospora]
MEQEVLHLLQNTQSTDESTRKAAELQLLQSYANPSFPLALLALAIHTDVAVYLRQSAMLILKTYVVSTWSPKFEEEFKGTVFLSDECKAQIRRDILSICTTGQSGPEDDRKVKKAASLVATKIASVDFPDQWPELLPTLLHIISSNGADEEVHGALRVLSDLVDTGFSEDHFFAVARDLVSGLHSIATNSQRKPILRALSMSVFRSCFDTLEMVMEEHKVAVKGFLDEALKGWLPFFIETIQFDLPEPPSEEDETKEGGLPSQWRGLIALKLQVVKTVTKIRDVFPAALTPYSTSLFESVWGELSRIQPAYFAMFIADERQGRLEDADNLPYTLDFLVLEELDTMTILLRAPPVRSELENRLKQAPNGPASAEWLQAVMKLVTSYALISTEEEGLWDIDVNLFLSEETAVTANYTPRSASGELVIRGLGEWLRQVPAEALLSFTKTLYTSDTSWKEREAALYLANVLLRDFGDVEMTVSPEVALGFQDFINHSLQVEDPFLRARAYLLAGVMSKTGGEAFQQSAMHYLGLAASAMSSDPSEVVQVACIRALQDFLQGLPRSVSQPAQTPIINAISEYIASHDLRELADSDDLKVTLTETLRDAIDVYIPAVFQGDAINVLFTLASNGASNFQLASLVTETFEMISSSVSDLPLVEGHASPYSALCEKVLPSLTGAFDVGDLTHEDALTNLAAELLSALAECGSTPLPDSFIPTVMPKLNRVLLSSSDPELLRPATSAVKHILAHGPDQLFAWTNPNTRKGGVESLLVIIDRLLSPTIDDNAATEVGALAAELVEKAGAEKLGPYLLQLLQAVALRLDTAEKAPFIQSLILVFARLSLTAAKDVVDFLSQVSIRSPETHDGLSIVLSKWLENSINFAGYDEIRQNAMALSKIYLLQDARIANINVKGDLIVNPATAGRIKTRSQARLNPDTWTSIPADLKILKVLVEELSSASASKFANPEAAAAAAAALDSEDEDEDDGDYWEDVGPSSTLDLGMGVTKQDLMGWGGSGQMDGSAIRVRDDETTEYLVRFFKSIGGNEHFVQAFEHGFNEEERDKLRNTIHG